MFHATVNFGSEAASGGDPTNHKKSQLIAVIVCWVDLVKMSFHVWIYTHFNIVYSVINVFFI